MVAFFVWNGRATYDVEHLLAWANDSLSPAFTNTTGGYVQMSAERLREPMQRVTDKLKRLCQIGDDGDEKVVALPQRRS